MADIILNPTLADLTNRLKSDGTVDPLIVEILSQNNEILTDMVLVEANDVTSHTSTIRTGLPKGTWRKLNYGVPAEKSETVQVKDSIGMLESYADVDKKLADLNGNTAAWRLSEEKAFIEGMSQTMADTVFFGDTAKTPEKFLGISARFSSLKAKNGVNVIDAGGTGNSLTSIWLIVWGQDTVHGIYPKGSPAGLKQQDLGEVTLYDSNQNKYQGYSTHYSWDLGLVLRDWRYVVRIANIDVTKLSSDPKVGVDLIDKITDAMERVQNLTGGRPALYANRTITSFLRRQIINKTNVNLTLETVAGKSATVFDGVPVRKIDALTATESQVK